MRIFKLPLEMVDALRSWFHPKDRSIILAPATFIEGEEIVTPAHPVAPGNPAHNRGRLYWKDGCWTQLDENGNEQALCNDNNGQFRVSKSATQTLTTGTNTTVVWETENQDDGAWFASNTFTPQRAGTYFFTAQVELADFAAAGNVFLINLAKNGVATLNNFIRSQGVLSQTVAISGTLTANGSTDTFTVIVQQQTGGNRNITATANRNLFAGWRIGD